jgi:hypothetical protein
MDDLEYLQEVCGDETEEWEIVETDLGNFYIRIIKSDGSIAIMSQKKMINTVMAARTVLRTMFGTGEERQ